MGTKKVTPKTMSTLPHITIDEVSDDLIRELYGPRIVNDWVPPTELIQTRETTLRQERQLGRSLQSPRRLDFYNAANGKGIQLTTDHYSARIFLSYPERREGFTSSFYTDSGVGILQTFNVRGRVERMAGRWVTDEQTGLEVFIKDNSLRPNDRPFVTTDEVTRYNTGFFVSCFINGKWPKAIDHEFK